MVLGDITDQEHPHGLPAFYDPLGLVFQQGGSMQQACLCAEDGTYSE